MKIIRCKNRIIEELRPCPHCRGTEGNRCELCNGDGYLNKATAGRNRECGRKIGFLTDLQFDLLRVDPEGTIFRCPSCPPDQRWIRVSYNEKEKMFVYSTMDKPDMSKFATAKYDNIEIFEQVA